MEGASSISRRLGISSGITGLTIVAIGTSLPDLVTSIIAPVKGSSEMAIGNAVGSCILNILLVLGISSVIHEQTSMPTSIIDLVMVLLATATLFVFVYTGKGRKISRVEGVIMLACILRIPGG